MLNALARADEKHSHISCAVSHSSRSSRSSYAINCVRSNIFIIALSWAPCVCCACVLLFSLIPSFLHVIAAITYCMSQILTVYYGRQRIKVLLPFADAASRGKKTSPKIHIVYSGICNNLPRVVVVSLCGSASSTCTCVCKTVNLLEVSIVVFVVHLVSI